MNNDLEKNSETMTEDELDSTIPQLMGKASAMVNERLTAKEIVDEFVFGAAECLKKGSSVVVSQSKL